MKAQVQIIKKSSPQPEPSIKAAPPPQAPAANKALPPENPPGTGQGKQEKAFVRNCIKDSLARVTLINGATICGRIIFWDRYSFGLAPDDGTPSMLVHKQHLATIQPLTQAPSSL